jgi:hypothetical protein
MSFTVSGLAAYIENQDFPLVAQIQVSSNTAALASKQTGIKGSSKLHFLASTIVFQDGANCTRSANMATTLTDRTLTVGDIALYEDLCAKDLIGKYTQIYMQKGAAGDSVLPAEIDAVYMQQKMEGLKKQLEISDWQSVVGSGTNNLSYYDGWIEIIDAGSPVTGNTGSVTSVTSANIIAVLQAMFLAIPQNIRGREDLSVFMPREYYDLYVVALINANLFHFVGEDGVSKLHGTNIAVRPTDGLNGTDRMFLTWNENLVIGMDGDADEDNMTVRLDPVTEKNIFFDVNFKRGTQVYFTEEVVEFTLA